MEDIEAVEAGPFTRRPLSARKRFAWIAALLAAVFAVFVAVGFATNLIVVYSGNTNAGVVVGWACHNIGYEWRGVPGFFTNSCS